MKHLVFFAEHLSFGGAERSLVEYLANIDRSKYKISLILRDKSPRSIYLLASVPEDIVIKTIYDDIDHVPTFVEKLMRKHFSKIDLTIRIHRALRQLGKCDLLLDFTSVLLKQANFFPNYKKIFWIHGPKSHMGPMELKKFSVRLNAYQAIATVSDQLKIELSTLLPKYKDRLFNIYNPFDLDRIRKSAEDESELTQKDRLLIQDKYILAVGRFAVEKDYFTLINAYAELYKDNFSFKLFIIGDGPDSQAIKDKISENKLETQIILLGFKENPYIWMKNAHFFVHSAKIEGFGMVLVEAMALGKAIIATDCPVGPGEILQRGKYGVLVPVADAMAMANAIEYLTNHSEKVSELGQLSLERTRAYSKEILLPDFYEVIDSI